MNCLEVQGLILRYINDELSEVELEEFLMHIDKCEDCKEELEIYYIATKGMQQLENDYVHTYNFHEAFEKQLKDSRKQMQRNTKGYLFKIILLDIIIMVIAILLTADTSYVDYDRLVDNEVFNGISID